MPYDPIQVRGQRQESVKVAKMADFKVCLLHRYAMHVIKRLTANNYTPRQCLNSNQTRFLIFVFISRHTTFKLRLLIYHLWQTNFHFYDESTGSPVRGLFISLLNPNADSRIIVYGE